MYILARCVIPERCQGALLLQKHQVMYLDKNVRKDPHATDNAWTRIKFCVFKFRINPRLTIKKGLTTATSCTDSRHSSTRYEQEEWPGIHSRSTYFNYLKPYTCIQKNSSSKHYWCRIKTLNIHVRAHTCIVKNIKQPSTHSLKKRHLLRSDSFSALSHFQRVERFCSVTM